MTCDILLAVLSYSLISYLNGLLAINLYNPITNLSPLPDFGFRYLPHISSMYPNMLLLIGGIYFAARFFRLKNLKKITEMIWCITGLFTIRILTFPVTIVPPSISGCINNNNTSGIELNVLKYLILSNDNTCTDYMFSGHACYLMLFLLFTLELSKNKLEKLLCSIFTMISLVSIICGRIHYTADVVVAIALSFLFYRNFTKTRK